MYSMVADVFDNRLVVEKLTNGSNSAEQLADIFPSLSDELQLTSLELAEVFNVLNLRQISANESAKTQKQIEHVVNVARTLAYARHFWPFDNQSISKFTVIAKLACKPSTESTQLQRAKLATGWLEDFVTKASAALETANTVDDVRNAVSDPAPGLLRVSTEDMKKMLFKVDSMHSASPVSLQEWYRPRLYDMGWAVQRITAAQPTLMEAHRSLVGNNEAQQKVREETIPPPRKNKTQQAGAGNKVKDNYIFRDTILDTNLNVPLTETRVHQYEAIQYRKDATDTKKVEQDTSTFVRGSDAKAVLSLSAAHSVVRRFQYVMDKLLGVERDENHEANVPDSFVHRSILKQVNSISASLESMFKALAKLYTKGNVPMPRTTDGHADASPTPEQETKLRQGRAIFTILSHMLCDHKSLGPRDSEYKSQIPIDSSCASMLSQFVIGTWVQLNSDWCKTMSFGGFEHVSSFCNDYDFHTYFPIESFMILYPLSDALQDLRQGTDDNTFDTYFGEIHLPSIQMPTTQTSDTWNVKSGLWSVASTKLAVLPTTYMVVAKPYTLKQQAILDNVAKWQRANLEQRRDFESAVKALDEVFRSGNSGGKLNLLLTEYMRARNFDKKLLAKTTLQELWRRCWLNNCSVKESPSSQTESDIALHMSAACDDSDVVDRLYRHMEKILLETLVVTVQLVSNIVSHCATEIHNSECNQWIKRQRLHVDNLIQCAYDTGIVKDSEVLDQLQVSLGNFDRLVVKAPPKRRTLGSVVESMRPISTGPGSRPHVQSDAEWTS